MSKLPEKIDLVIAFSGRKHGNMSLYCEDNVTSLENRRNFLNNLGIDYKALVCARQAHGANVRYVTEEDKGKGALVYDSAVADSDGFITDKKNVPLAVFTADCLSVFIYDPKTPAVGLVHCGWRSTKEDIIPKAVKLMEEKFNAEPKNFVAGFGSGIRGCCYEVSEDFKDYFSDGLTQKNNKFYLDLHLVNRLKLLKAGLKEENIFPPQVCTFCHNDEFFSYRKEGPACARMMSVVMLK